MTDNERIARWLGPFIEDIYAQWPPDNQHEKGFRIIPNKTLTVLEGCVVIAVPLRRWQYWQPDRDITLWHGKEGLFAKIEEQGKRATSATGGVRAMNLWEEFYRQWMETHNFSRQMPYATETTWAFRRAEPAELATALARVIERGK